MKFFRNKRRPRVDPIIADYTRRVRDSRLFDAQWYLATYPELGGFGPGPLAHFCEYGLHEHRDPGPNFDTRRYLDAIPEAGTGSLPPLLHAIEAGEAGTGSPVWLRDDEASLVYLIRTSGLFDEAWYRDTYPDVDRSGRDPLAHYLDCGAAELRDPGPDFDAEHYVLTYPHYRDTFPTPLVHFLRLGLRRGYRPTGLSRYGRWLAEYDDLNEVDLERIATASAPYEVQVILIADHRSVNGIADFLKVLADQAGVFWRATLLRGPDMDAASWTTVVAQAAGEPRAVCSETATALLNGLPDRGIVLLATGASRLRPHACYAFAAALNHGTALGAYSDHDRIDGTGTRHAPVFTPEMSAVLMRQVPYAGAVVALRLTPSSRGMLALALGRLAPPDRTWADLLLALDPACVIRIPLILHHRAVHEAVPASRTNQPVPDPPRSAAPASDLPSERLPTVRIIIPTRDRSTLLRACIDSILARTDYPSERYRVVIVDNASSRAETARYFAEATADPRIGVVASPGAFNFSEICNAGAANADEDILVFLNNDTTVRQPNWLRRLVGHAGRPETGAVGAQLLYPNDTVQHGGVVLGIAGVGAHALVNLPAETAQTVDATREMSAVTGACLAIRRTVFAEIGGFDPLLRIDYNDVDLCCAGHAVGYRNIYIAEPLLHHHESLSRGASTTRADQGRNVREAIRVRRRHAAVIRDDPSYNPNLSLKHIGGFAVPPRVIPPWRRPPAGSRRVLLLSAGRGDGIGRWVNAEAAFLAARGFEVILGGSDGEDAADGPDCRRIRLDTPEEAAVFATREGVDAVVVHTAPFFAVTQHLGRRPLVYVVDHGEPPVGPSSGRDARAAANLDKRYHASLARRVFSTSPASRDPLFGQETVLLAHDRPPEAAWSDAWAERRPLLREMSGFTGRFIVIASVGMDEDDGFEDLVACATEYPFTDPALATRPLFVAAGRGPLTGPAERIPADLVTFADLGEADLIDLLAAADLYLNPQHRQGADCDIALALAMGLPVVASDISAHRAYAIETASDVPGFCRLIGSHAERWRAGAVHRAAAVTGCTDPLAVMADTIALDLDRDSAEHWI